MLPKIISAIFELVAIGIFNRQLPLLLKFQDVKIVSDDTNLTGTIRKYPSACGEMG
jgi:hypothetical protein